MATAFPTGVTSFGVPVIGSGLAIPVTTGNYYFVSSTKGSNGNDGLTPQNPLATVAYAITLTTASNGDCIVMMPYHRESIAAAGGWTPLAGTSIVGLGWGGTRPLIKTTATTSTILCSAANLLFQNFVVQAGITETVTIFSISGKDVIINAVDYQEDATNNYTCISFLTTTAAASRFMVLNCRHNSTTVPVGTAAWMSIVGGDGWTIENNELNVIRATNAASCAIGTLTPAATNVLIRNNVMNLGLTGAGKICVSLFAGTTGLVCDNRGIAIGATLASQFGCAGAGAFQNYAAHTANASGIIEPAVDS